jgi:hypothetical protein
MTPNEMRANGDTEQSIAYWQTRTIYWNGEPVMVLAPNPPSQDEE